MSSRFLFLSVPPQQQSQLKSLNIISPPPSPPKNIIRKLERDLSCVSHFHFKTIFSTHCSVLTVIIIINFINDASSLLPISHIKFSIQSFNFLRRRLYALLGQNRLLRFYVRYIVHYLILTGMTLMYVVLVIHSL